MEFKSFRAGLGEVFGTLFGMVLVEFFGQGDVLVDEHLGAQDCGGGARREVTSPWVGRSSSSGSHWIDAVAKVLFGVWGGTAILVEPSIDPPLIRGGSLVISKDPSRHIGVMSWWAAYAAKRRGRQGVACAACAACAPTRDFVVQFWMGNWRAFVAEPELFDFRFVQDTI